MSKFDQSVIIAARASQRVWAVPASVSLAQFALESGYGTHMPKDSFNCFGIKALANQPFVEASTREVINGKDVVIKAKFRKFADFNEAFDAHARLLATKSIYAPAMERWKAGDLEGGIRLMAKKYATDPSYAAKLLSLIGAQQLAQYDKLDGPPVPMPAPPQTPTAIPIPAEPGSIGKLIVDAIKFILSLIPKRKP